MPETFAPYDVTPEAPSSAECDYCDDGAEYGPHSHELYESREGASLHTADELVDIFLDAVEAYAAPYRRPDDCPRDVVGWCEDPDDSEALSDEIMAGESALYDAGFYVYWDDGYSIGRIIETDDAECEWLVVEGPPSGEYIGDCSCGQPLYRSRFAGTTYHASE